MSAAAAVRSQPFVTPATKVRALSEVFKRTQGKIREDLFRFRTCCSDPRASL
jgi:hypothetical protein